MPEPPEDWTPYIGRKVTMRYLLGDPEHPHTELLGVLQSVETDSAGATVLKLMDKRGQTHLVKQSDVVAAKVF